MVLFFCEKEELEVQIMFWIGFIIGLFIGANVSLILYACILAGKESDKHYGSE